MNQQHLNIRRFFSFAALFVLILILSGGCTQRKSIANEFSPEVMKGVEIKIQDFRDKKAKECIEKALEYAITYTDSLLSAQAFGIKTDTIQRPDRVQKPVRPLFKDIPDTIKVKPIIK